MLANWESEGCDLWEEVRSTDFYFNRMAYVYSLNVAADFGEMLGETSGPSQYRQLAETIKVQYLNLTLLAFFFLALSTLHIQIAVI